MDTTKQNPVQGAQESDDLIAELARLVAQDARIQSVNSAVYSNSERPVEPEPVYDPVEREPAPNDEAYPPESSSDRQEPDFMFNFDRHEAAVSYQRYDTQTETAPESDQLAQEASEGRDPIADLIADADRESFDLADVEPETDNFELRPDVPTFSEAEDIPHDDVRGNEPETAHSAPDAYFAQLDDYQPKVDRNWPGDDRDPLSEIEALIGEAARVSVDAEANGGRRVRSSFLDTADYQDMKAERAVDAAEAAILAAAAAGGASVAQVRAEPDPMPVPESFSALDSPKLDQAADAGEVDSEFGPLEKDAHPQRERRRAGFLVPAMAGAVIVIALAGAYVLFMAPSPVPSEAPVLTADAGELKDVPDNTNAATTASESVIFNEIDGNTVAPEDEVLVSRDQTGGATGAEVGQVIAPEEGEVGLANRPVRTVTVRPDGTIVSSDNSVAGSNVLPVERPDVPVVPNSTLTSDPIGEAIAAAISEESPSTPSQVPAESAASAVVAETATAVENAIIDPATIPRPIPRPSGLSSSAPAPQPAPVSTPTQIATAPAQTSVPPADTGVATPPSGSVGAWVQLSSQRTEEAARADIPSLQSRYGSLFNGTPLDVSRVDLGDRGIYYRVRLPQQSLANANSVCDAIKGQGGDCFVLNNN